MNKASHQNTITVGDLVATAYDHAETLTAQSNEAAELAARTVARWLTRAERLDLIRRMASNESRPSNGPRPRFTTHARAA
ncbi:MAG TPA: hypothetical protein VGG33_12055 [Polyangia bacterium]